LRVFRDLSRFQLIERRRRYVLLQEEATGQQKNEANNSCGGQVGSNSHDLPIGKIVHE
jgi:hypothetical protein